MAAKKKRPSRKKTPKKDAPRPSNVISMTEYSAPPEPGPTPGELSRLEDAAAAADVAAVAASKSGDLVDFWPPPKIPGQVREGTLAEYQKPGMAALEALVDLINAGKPIPAEQMAGINLLLGDFQARADLAVIGQLPMHMGRLQRLQVLIGTAESKIEGMLTGSVPISPEDVVRIYKALNSEAEAVNARMVAMSSRATTSSPDSMSRATVGAKPADPGAPLLPTDSRRRITEMARQFRHVMARRIREEAEKNADAIEMEPSPTETSA